MTTATTHSTAPGSPNIDRLVFRFAGIFILASLVLAYFHSYYWLWLNVFVGANMLQASYTGFCPLAIMLRKLGVQSATAFAGSGENA